MSGRGEFEPPGPGSWVLDTTHFTQPVTRFTREVFAEPVQRGFRDSTRPYGLLLDCIAWGFVDHWPYLSPRRVPELPPTRDLTREGWTAAVETSPALSARLATSATVFERRAWRDDLSLWDEEVKPAAVRAHRQLAAVEPRDLDAGALLAHFDRCRVNLRWALYQHHRFNVAPVIPVGDFLVEVEGLTGTPGAELLGLLRSPTPTYLGAGDALDAVAAALRDDAGAAETLRAVNDPGAVLAGLRAGQGPASRAVDAYVDRVGDWPIGSGADVGDPRLVEVPSVLVGAMTAALAGEPVGAAGALAAASAEVRGQVPGRRRHAFDESLAEARASYRVRDERATFCDVWAFGLARRAMLAAGERLASAGVVDDPRHLIEAGSAEIAALLAPQGPSGPTELAEELARRATERATASFDQAPPFLGPAPDPPVPVAWLPPGAARTERAFRAYVDAMSGDDEDDEIQPGGDGHVTGVGASPGTYEGTARIVRGAAELSRLAEGDVLVAGSTSPAFNAVLPLLGAIVTDSGGLLSHAAIVAREYGIPAVVGTGTATRRIVDGSRVRVDGNRGEVSPAP